MKNGNNKSYFKHENNKTFFELVGRLLSEVNRNKITIVSV